VVDPRLVGADELAADRHRGRLASEDLARPTLAVREVRAVGSAEGARLGDVPFRLVNQIWP